MDVLACVLLTDGDDVFGHILLSLGGVGLLLIEQFVWGGWVDECADDWVDDCAEDVLDRNMCIHFYLALKF